MVNTTNAFVEVVLRESRYTGDKSNLHVVYIPLHGANHVPVTRILMKVGFCCDDVVEQQANEDGNFQAVGSQNPEDRRVLELGICQAELSGVDVVSGTATDSDCVGIAVCTENGYRLLNGKRIGVLLMDYVMSCHIPI